MGLLSYILGLGLIIQLCVGVNSVYAADSAHYELVSWKAGVVGSSAGVTFGYISPDGTHLTGRLPLDRSMFNGHENDSSWTGIDSAAPILAYINKYGFDNNIQEAMNPSYFDPTILKALAGQGVSVQQLGGPANPQAGKANYSNSVDKALVGVGISASSSSSSSSTASSPTATTQSSSQPTATSNAQSSSPSLPAKPSSPTEAKASTEQSKETAADSKANPHRLDPPAFALTDTTPTKIPTPKDENAQTKKSNWMTAAEIAGGIILVGGLLGGVYWKYGRVPKVKL
ncbi:hypothetical protein [Desulfitobacterium sp. AusDCA]|uniref:hypothetical protein n=1 Tax=Desulfitobacterium sp. AusDCA TaxID=3240383 RepID=UPI003DA71733